MALNFCSNCGAKVDATMKFCINCGALLVDLPTPLSVPSPLVAAAEQPSSPALSTSMVIERQSEPSYQSGTATFLPLPPSAPPPGYAVLPQAPGTAMVPAWNVGRAVGVAIGVIAATIAFYFVADFARLIGYSIGAYYFYEAEFISLIGVTFAVITAFWLGALRLARVRFWNLFLRATIGNIALLLILTAAPSIISSIQGERYYYFNVQAFLISVLLAVCASLLGTGLAFGLAPWPRIRAMVTHTPAAIGDYLLVWGTPVVLSVVFGIAFLLLNSSYYGFYSFYYEFYNSSLFALGTLVLIVPIVAPIQAARRLRGITIMQPINSGMAPIYMPPSPSGGGPVYGAPPASGLYGAAPLSGQYGAAPRQAPLMPRQNDGLAIAILSVFGAAVLSAFAIPDYFFVIEGSTTTSTYSNLSGLQNVILAPGLLFQGATVVALVMAIVLIARSRAATNLTQLRVGTMLTAMLAGLAGIAAIIDYVVSITNYANNLNYCDPYYSNCANAQTINLTIGPGLYITGILLGVGALLAFIRLVNAQKL